jgi:hypothetical protein
LTAVKNVVKGVLNYGVLPYFQGNTMNENRALKYNCLSYGLPTNYRNQHFAFKEI